MRDDLLVYYERELAYLRRMGAEFADKYPKIAGRLLLEPDKCDDPHVERLLEGFSFLAARLHLKLDDDFPQITEALLNVVYPHYLRPVPSMSIVQIHPDPEQLKPDTGLKIPRSSMLFSRPVDGVPCRFQTCYDTELWPVTVVDARWGAAEGSPAFRGADTVGAIRLVLRCFGDLTFSQLRFEQLRFHLTGDTPLVNTLYELLSNNCKSILVHSRGARAPQWVTLSVDALRPVGFGPEEGMTPFPRRSFAGYQTLQEYFGFPRKFFFFDLHGLDAVTRAGFGSEIEIVFAIAPFEREERRQTLEGEIAATTFRLGCTPVVNLFPQTCEPILIEHTRSEYPILPDVTRMAGIEIFSIEEVLSADPRTQEFIRFESFYSYRHGTRHQRPMFWTASRRRSGRVSDEGTDMYLTLVDLTGKPGSPDVESVTVRAICSNRDVASKLPFGNEAGDFELEAALPVRRIVALTKPTKTYRAPLANDIFWRLISQLSLNYLSLVDEGVEALRELLRLYDFTREPHSARQIEGLLTIHSARHFARVSSEDGVVFARGTRVEVELDEDEFVGGGAFLFAAVLEHFLGLYVSMNSFSQLLARTKQRKELLRLWPPRAGRKILL